ncbi:sensor histidine kinase [Limisalsivibrio acetivorans]|uniref:sensor histidine kinase n=1 Tax=Limisalsivibrio acetivorans TaxID=1304888 RepID=UPI000421D5C5|nr:histidine kinase dimerization/phosphoacceptor domain -containing protein [Limisalsivibrio acetivorans]
MKKHKSTLVYRLFIWTFLFFLFITALFTAVELYRERESERSRLNRYVNHFFEAQINSIAEGLWVFDREILEAQAKAAVFDKNINFIYIEDNSGVIKIEEGERMPSPEISITREIIRERGSEQYLLGKITLQATLEPIGMVIKENLPYILFSTGIKVLLVASMITILFYLFIVRHIIKASNYADQVSIDDVNSIRPLSLNKHSADDELDILASSINKLIDNTKKELMSRLAAEKRLQAEKMRLLSTQATLEKANRIGNTGHWEYKPDEGKVWRSPQMLNLLTLDTEETTETMDDLYHRIIPEDAYIVEDFMNSLEKLDTFEFEYRIKTPYGNIKHILEKGEVVKDKDGHILSVLGLARDITEIREAEKEKEGYTKKIQGLYNELETILNTVVDGVIKVDDTGHIVYVNNSAATMLEYEQEEMIGRNHHALVHHTKSDGTPYPENECCVSKAYLSGEQCRTQEDIFWRKSGRSITVDSSSTPIKRDDTIIGAVISFRDITEQTANRRELQKSLKDKETLLKEIHHRVKNNLQIVSSLLSLQSLSINEEDAVYLRASQDRIMTMALIHKMLYESDDLGHVEMSEYVTSLFNYLKETYHTTGVQLRGRMERVFLSIDKAIPCGLIVNELLTNTLKYAFTEKEMDKIVHVSIFREDNDVVLRIKDNGKGLPRDFNIDECESLGLQLVQNLTEQLYGRLKILKGQGAGFEIRFEE